MQRFMFALGRALRRRPRLRWILWGAAVGAVFGLFFGGIGIAARGGAVGLWGWAVFGVAGGFIGDWRFRKRTPAFGKPDA